MDEKEIIEHYNYAIRYHKIKKENKEDILAEKEKVLQAFRESTKVDLLIIYYMHRIKGFPRLSTLRSLQKYYEAEQELRTIFQKDEPRT